MIFQHHLNPAILHIGPIQITWYGLMYVIAFILASHLFRKFSKEKTLHLTFKQIDTLMLYGFLGLLIGARLFYILFYNFHFYLEHPSELLTLQIRGLSFHGGLLGIIIAVIFFAKKHHRSFWNISGHVVIAAPLGIMMVRLGNFINGELYGRLTNGSWGVIFPDGGPHPRHPSQLYEAFSEGILLFFIMYFTQHRWKPHHRGPLFLILYGCFRFLMEFFREPDAQLGFIMAHLSMGQILCLIMIFSGSLLLYLHSKSANFWHF